MKHTWGCLREEFKHAHKLITMRINKKYTCLSNTNTHVYTKIKHTWGCLGVRSWSGIAVCRLPGLFSQLPPRLVLRIPGSALQCNNQFAANTQTYKHMYKIISTNTKHRGRILKSVNPQYESALCTLCVHTYLSWHVHLYISVFLCASTEVHVVRVLCDRCVCMLVFVARISGTLSGRACFTQIIHWALLKHTFSLTRYVECKLYRAGFSTCDVICEELHKRKGNTHFWLAEQFGSIPGRLASANTQIHVNRNTALKYNWYSPAQQLGSVAGPLAGAGGAARDADALAVQQHTLLLVSYSWKCHRQDRRHPHHHPHLLHHQSSRSSSYH